MLEADKCCLVVVDVQGKLAQLMDQRQSLFGNIQTLIRMAGALDIPILWCEQNPRALGPTIGELGELLDGETPIAKMSFSCCGDEVFRRRLKETGRKHVILCGIESHICVYQTMMDLLDGDMEVTIVADAVSSRTPENKRIAIDRMNAEGASISSTEMLMFELLGTCEHPRFRELARLIK